MARDGGVRGQPQQPPSGTGSGQRGQDSGSETLLAWMVPDTYRPPRGWVIFQFQKYSPELFWAGRSHTHTHPPEGQPLPKISSFGSFGGK